MPHLLSNLPPVSPSQTGLPGISTITGFLSGLELYGGLAALAGILIGALVWALAAHNHNSHWSHSGRSAVGVSLLAGVLVGAAPALANFFINAGGTVH